MFIHQQLSVWQVGIMLGDVTSVVRNVRRTAKVITVIEERFLFCSVIRDVAITSLRGIRVARIIQLTGGPGLVFGVVLGRGV